MDKEEQIFDLLERLYIELQSTKKELKEEISGVEIKLTKEISSVRSELKGDISNLRTELKGEISNVRTELKEDIKGIKEDINILNDNQMIIFDKLEKIESDVVVIREEMEDVQTITASNYKDIVRLKSIR